MDVCYGSRPLESSGAGVERLDGLADVCHILGRNFRIHGERQHFLRSSFAHWKIAGLVSQLRETFLQVKRQRVVDLRANTMLFQIALQPVTLFTADYVLVINMARLIRVNRWRPHWNSCRGK